MKILGLHEHNSKDSELQTTLKLLSFWNVPVAVMVIKEICRSLLQTCHSAGCLKNFASQIINR